VRPRDRHLHRAVERGRDGFAVVDDDGTHALDADARDKAVAALRVLRVLAIELGEAAGIGLVIDA
jgi:hypothetical protein